MTSAQARRRDHFLALDRAATEVVHSCEHCQKMAYRSRAKARKVLQRDLFRGQAMSPYPCPMGNGFHIGHLPRAIRTGATSRQAKYGVGT